MGHILVGFDGSDPSRRALDFAIARAKPQGDEVVVLTVIPPSVKDSSLAKMMPAGLELPAAMAKTFEENARARLDEVIRERRAAGSKIRGEVRAGEAMQAFLDAAKEFGASEIVIGHKSFEREDLALGPIAERLVKHMPATVTVVR
jgi:nucleotide-binding universal stress UspA family protein